MHVQLYPGYVLYHGGDDVAAWVRISYAWFYGVWGLQFTCLGGFQRFVVECLWSLMPGFVEKSCRHCVSDFSPASERSYYF